MRRDEDEPPGPPRDGRLRGLVYHREATPLRQRRQHRLGELSFQEPSRRGRARWAAEILGDFGDPECPLATPPTAELMREARRALRWSMSEAAWRLGFDHRSGERGRLLETGQRVPPRFVRLLMMRALRDLAAQQRLTGPVRTGSRS